MAWVNVLQLFYPIGIIIEFDNFAANPAELFGGTWTRYPDDVPSTGPYKWRRIG